MSAPVDVLAVLSRRSAELTRKYGADNDLAEVRAAVAELVEAVEATRAARGGIMSLCASDASVVRLWSALARVRGAA